MAQLNDLLVLGKSVLLGSIKSNADHDLLSHSNEFTFASPGHNTSIYINYRTSGGTDGSIAQYRFCKGDGAGTLVPIYASTFYGTLSGNASSATMLTSSAGSNTLPVYFTGGKPAAVTNIEISSTSTDSKYVKTTNSNGSVGVYASTNRGLYDFTKSAWIVYNNTAGNHTYIPLWKSKGSATLPVYFNADGEPVACNTSLAVSISGNAATATALTSNAGSSTLPIYFSGGKPAACSTTLGVSITGNAATATIARKVENSFDRDSSNYKDMINFFDSDGSTVHQYIGGHNTGSTNGAIIINPDYDSTKNKWDSEDGLYVGATTLKWNGNTHAVNGAPTLAWDSVSTIGTIFGTALTVKMPANPNTQLSKNTRMEYGWDGVNYFNISGTAGNAAKVNDTPTTAWWHIMRFNHANSSGYYTDLAIPFNTTSLYYKRITAGAVQDGGWVKVLDALNYSSYALSLSGGTMKGDITLNSKDVNIIRAGISQSWYQGRNSAMIKTTSYSGYDAILSMKTTAGDWSLGVYNDNKLYFTYVLDTHYNANTNTTTAQIRFDPDGTVVASKFSGSLSGNATTATGFASAKTITLTGNVTGSATGGNGSNGWSIATTVASVPNAALPIRLQANQAATGAKSDANDALETGFYYMDSTGTNRPSFSQSTNKDYRILTTAYGSTWLQQIATDFRCNDIFYRRKENGTWKSWVQIQTTESADARYAPINHASTTTTYGVGDATHYGHVILYPAASCSTYTSDSGGAITPAAVKKAFTLFDKYHTRVYSTGLQISTGTNVDNMYVPVATTSQAGVVSTSTQSFKGQKTFTGTIVLNNADYYSSLAFLPSIGSSTMGLIYVFSGTSGGTTYTQNRFAFRQYSYTTGSATRLSYYEQYYLPNTNADRTANATYTILTTKSTVTTAQGGTGNTSYTANRLVWTESATKMTAGYHFANASKIGVNYTSEPSYNFYVGGTSYFSNTVTGATTGSFAQGFAIAQTSGAGAGISLYSGVTANAAPTYGLMFAKTATFGTFGGVTSDWATYFTMNDSETRGWIFRRGTTNVCSISGLGSIWTSSTVTANKLKISNTGGNSHIEFSRQSHNYIHAPSNAGTIALCANATLGLATSGLVVSNTAVYPGANNAFTLGTSGYKWSNVYATTLNGSHNGNILGVTETNPTTGTRYSPLFIATGGDAAASTSEYTRRANADFNIWLYQGTASATGYSWIELGNAIASGTAGNKSGGLRLYSINTGYTDLEYANTTSNVTTTIPPYTGNLIVNYGEYNPTSATTLSVGFQMNSGQRRGYNNGMRYLTLEGTASANGYGILILGNSTATGTAANKYGGLRIYSTSSGYNYLRATASTSNYTNYLPAVGGTLLNTKYIVGYAGTNYGTTAQRDALTPTTGQMFFVLI